VNPRYFLPVATLAVLLWFFARGLDRDPRIIDSPLVGRAMPSFKVADLSRPGEYLTEETLKGRYVLLNIWGTWCAQCFEEHGFLLELRKSGAIPIYGLNWKDDRESAMGWLRKLGNPYQEVGFDDSGNVAIEWGVYGAPETFLVSPDGIVLHKHIGPMTADVWQRGFIPRIRATQ
jgi:cytochrome c biogenesis protein CcmG/thiol:disulfide interchange protein DsbE